MRQVKTEKTAVLSGTRRKGVLCFFQGFFLTFLQQSCLLVSRGMRIYIAGRLSRYKEFQKYARQLDQLGYLVTSRWIWRDRETLTTTTHWSTWSEHAIEDMEDLIAADMVLFFSEDAEGRKTGRNRGGRHVEFGMGIGLNLECVVIGEPENAFHALPLVERYESFEAFLKEQDPLEVKEL